MAAATNQKVPSPAKYNLNNCDLSASECSNCVSLVKQLHSALEEIESIKLIIKLLQKESVEEIGVDNRIIETTNLPSNTSAIVYTNGLEHDNWITSTKKDHRKGYSPTNLTKVSNSYTLPTNNCYEQLLNLQDPFVPDDTPQIQGEENTLDIHNYDHHIKPHHQRRETTQRVVKKKKEDPQIYHIPTLLNGTTTNKILKIVSSERTCKKNTTKHKLSQHKVTMIGDSFLRGIRDNVELSLSNNFSTCSMVKPGGDLTTLLESANSATESLTQKDVIVICGGLNDFNLDKTEPTTDHIREFIKTHNHSNIVLVNVPV
jgi:hypothetical protein